MNTQIIVTVTGPDEPGILAQLAKETHELSGKWLDSRISQLDGQLVGLLKIELPEQNLSSLKQQFSAHAKLSFLFNVPSQLAHSATKATLTYHCQDRPGIVNDVSHALNDIGVGIEHMECRRVSVTSVGETLFTAEFQLSLPDNLDQDAVLEKLNALDPHANASFSG